MNNNSVLIIGNFLSRFVGTYGVCEELAKRFRQKGVTVFAASGNAGRLGRLTDMIKTTVKYRRRYDVAQVDVYSGYAFWWAEAVSYLIRAMRKRLILSLHGGELPAFAERQQWRTQSLFRMADHITTPSGYLKASMDQYSRLVQIVPNPLALKTYPYNVPCMRGPHLVWLRAFHHIYNPEMAPKVLSEVVKYYPDARLTMVGPDKGDGSFQVTRNVVGRLGLTDRVVFKGRVRKSEVPGVLNKGDFFLNTSLYDNTPVSVMEGMASGLIVMSTKVGGMPWMIEDGRNGFLFATSDVRGMAGRIVGCMDDRERSAKVSQAARRSAEEWDWENVWPSWKSLLFGGKNEQ